MPAPKDKDKSDATQAAAAQPPINLTVVQEQPKPASPIPGFDKMVKGGCFRIPLGNDYTWVDAHGEPVAPETLKAHLEAKGDPSGE